MTWPIKKLGEICEFKYGKNLPEPKRRAGPYPVYGSASMVSTHDEFLVVGPGIIVGRKGTVGKLQYSKLNFFPIDTTFYVEANPAVIDMRFLFYRLGLCALSEMNSDAAVPGLNRNAALAVEITLPPLPVQKKIAGVLSAYDDLIETNLKRIKLLEEMAQITYEEWFVRLRFPNHETTPINPETSLPEGWQNRENGDCCEVSGGGTPSTENEDYWNEGEIAWFSPTDLSKANSLCLLDSGKKITELGLKNSSAKLTGPETFMMTSRATIGLFGIIGKPYSTNQGFIVVMPHEPFHKQFLLFNFKSRVQEFYSHATGATFPEISKSKFKRLQIVWPSKTIIQKFSDFATPITQEMMLLTKQNALLKEARDLLLPRLMTGLIDIDDYLARNGSAAVAA